MIIELAALPFSVNASELIHHAQLFPELKEAQSKHHSPEPVPFDEDMVGEGISRSARLAAMDVSAPIWPRLPGR